MLSSLGIGTYLGQPDEAYRRRLHRGDRRCRRKRHQRHRRRHQLPFPAQRAQHRRGIDAARSQRLLARQVGGLHQGRLSDSRRQNARRSQSNIFSTNTSSAEFFPPKTSPPAATAWRRVFCRTNWRAAWPIWASNASTSSTCTIRKRSSVKYPKIRFLGRVREAFHYLESAVDAGEIQFYGMATWNGFRQDARARDAMQLAEFAAHRAGDRRRQPPLPLRAASVQSGNDRSADARQSIRRREKP